MRFLAGADNSEEAMRAPVAPLIVQGGVFINADADLDYAADLFASHDVDLLPVIDNYGMYCGVIFRRDLVAVLTKNLRPPTVGGMATPLGVYLTTGSYSGGAGDLGLFLTGVSLAIMTILANGIVYALQLAVSRFTGLPLMTIINSPPLTLNPNIYDLALYISVILTVLIFMLILRLSPLSGYHAAEHMTVHAIEAGEELTIEKVSKMPRVHPRCGTNLLAAAGVFIIITTKMNNQLTVILALLVVILGWRSIGGLLQYLVTTKNPTPKQLANGVAAGNQILDQYQERPGLQLVGFARIWKMGFLQTAMGLFATWSIVFMIPSLHFLIK